MKVKDFMAVSGQAGLFRFLSQGKNSIIVEHLETGKRTSVFSTTKMSSLEEISIFTESEDIPLAEVFDKMHESLKGEAAISHKASAEEIKAAFEEYLPEYDKERVYVSDMKKVIQWYNILHKLELLLPDEEEKKEEGEEDPKEEPAAEKDDSKGETPTDE